MVILKLSSRGRAGAPSTVSLPEGVLKYAAPNVVVGSKHAGAAKYYKGLTYGPLVVLEAGEPSRAAADADEARLARDLSPQISASIDRSIQALKEADAFVQNSSRTVDGLLARLRASVA